MSSGRRRDRVIKMNVNDWSDRIHRTGTVDGLWALLFLPVLRVTLRCHVDIGINIVVAVHVDSSLFEAAGGRFN